ncbi:hypothetical protein [Haloferax volcanii]|uniref:Uncharacterized protein n=2 Tax=Haloferax volcanii TaxID=2246 RepID=L9VD79_HALVD|nr:hypothetical protein [Haloferax volcanii]ELY35165.1 hypothetical protein C498_04313 [Haloferax volcanii DS2]MBS8120910.1 hypothetical protein [Haloferax volcanii]MBS8125947.1 hypothetical protein [Haloferax volcanii]MBS8129800.1 hypothetical protein [Haloferax volcanii]MBS8133665.1 hypothetical protein [Haloferax volcanii]
MAPVERVVTPTDRHGDTHPAFDEESFRDALAEFGGTDAERRVVARQARDLADSGQAEADRGAPLTGDEIVRNMRDAPDGDPATRWNWWLGALEAAYGGYREFQVRRIPKA